MKTILIVLAVFTTMSFAGAAIAAPIIVPMTLIYADGMYSGDTDTLIDGFFTDAVTWFSDDPWYDPMFAFALGDAYWIKDIVIDALPDSDYRVEYYSIYNSWTKLYDASIVGPGGHSFFEGAPAGIPVSYNSSLEFGKVQARGIRFFGTSTGPTNYGITEIQLYGESVPEPATMLLLGTGLVGLVGAGRKKIFKKS